MKQLAAFLLLLLGFSAAFAQTPAPAVTPATVTTSTDLFLMLGTDFDRPGLKERANLNIGVGHSFDALSKSWVGNEITFGYTYENAGNHGWFHSQYGSHTEALGVMRNFNLTKKTFGAYTWLQDGLTTLTDYKKLENRFYNGEAVGLVVHFTPHQGIWIQESYNKVVTVPWYTSTGVGYTYSF